MKLAAGTLSLMRRSLDGLLTDRATITRFDVERVKGTTVKVPKVVADDVPCMVTPAMATGQGGSRRIRWDERVLAISTHVVMFAVSTSVDVGDDVAVGGVTYRVTAVDTGASGAGDTIRVRIACLVKRLA